MALEALCKCSALPQPETVGLLPQAFKENTGPGNQPRVGVGVGVGGLDYKGVSTNNRKRVLPSSGSQTGQGR